MTGGRLLKRRPPATLSISKVSLAPQQGSFAQRLRCIKCLRRWKRAPHACSSFSAGRQLPPLVVGGAAQCAQSSSTDPRDKNFPLAVGLRPSLARNDRWRSLLHAEQKAPIAGRRGFESAACMKHEPESRSSKSV